MISRIGPQRNQIWMNLYLAQRVTGFDRLREELESLIPAPGKLAGQADEEQRFGIRLGDSPGAIDFF